MRTLAVILALGIVAGGWLLLSSGQPETFDGRTVFIFENRTDGTVSYSYLAEPVPEFLNEREVPELRTENSYTTFDGVVKEGDDPTLKLTARIYLQPTFSKDSDGSWRYLEHATTTQAAWRARPRSVAARVRDFFAPIAYADSISPFSGAGDGYVTGEGFGANSSKTTAMTNAWASVAGSSATYLTTPLSVSGSMACIFDTIWECTATINRGFLPFNTSAMPGGSSVIAATLNVYVTSKSNTDDDGTDYITIMQSSQTSETTLAAADFDNMSGEGIDSGTRKDITLITTSAYLTFSLNSTGMSWIKGSGQTSNCGSTPGYTCLGLVEGHDFSGSFIGDGLENSIVVSSSEATGTTQDPYLEVTYTVPASVVQGALAVKGGGSLKITSGGIKIR